MNLLRLARIRAEKLATIIIHLCSSRYLVECPLDIVTGLTSTRSAARTSTTIKWRSRFPEPWQNNVISSASLHPPTQLHSGARAPMVGGDSSGLLHRHVIV